MKYDEIIEKAYVGFNARKIDDVFLVMDPDVKWPKAFEGGYAIGHDAVRKYWTKQWSEINPIVEPRSITIREDGKVKVEAEQIVKDLENNVLFNGTVKHIYQIENNLITCMDVEA